MVNPNKISKGEKLSLYSFVDLLFIIFILFALYYIAQ